MKEKTENTKKKIGEKINKIKMQFSEKIKNIYTSAVRIIKKKTKTQLTNTKNRRRDLQIQQTLAG